MLIMIAVLVYVIEDLSYLFVFLIVFFIFKSMYGHRNFAKEKVGLVMQSLC